jgi:formylglycine-generating enzyme required for sulfatase activity
MARVESFCIDRYEAMLVAELPGGKLGPWSPYERPGDTPVSARSVAGVVPQGYVDQVQASEACLAAGKRLCTDAEWLRACRGAAQTTYPYGDDLLGGVCNDARSCHPVVQYFETDEAWIWSELAHPCINQLPEGLAPTGAHAGCESAEGVFDLMGNLHEWTADPAGTFRGGFYVDTVKNGPGCLYATTAHNVWHWDYSTGFRCCADAL